MSVKWRSRGLRQALRAGLGRTRQLCRRVERGIGPSARLRRGIRAPGWTFLFRLPKQSQGVLADRPALAFYDQVSAPGQTCSASGPVFKRRVPGPAQLRVLWAAHAPERWALLTPAPTLTGWQSAQRAWLEPLLILRSLADTALLFLGLCQAQAQQTFPKRRRPDGSYIRRCSLFQEGRAAFTAAGWAWRCLSFRLVSPPQPYRGEGPGVRFFLPFALVGLEQRCRVGSIAPGQRQRQDRDQVGQRQQEPVG